MFLKRLASALATTLVTITPIPGWLPTDTPETDLGTPNQEVLAHVSLPAESTVDPKTPKLQEALADARSYIDSSMEAWETHRLYLQWEYRAEKSQEELEEAQQNADELIKVAEGKEAEASESATTALNWYRQQQRAPLSRTTAIVVAENPEQMIRNYQTADNLHQRANHAADRAEEDAQEAQQLRAQAQAALEEVEAKHADVVATLNQAKKTSEQAQAQQDEANERWDASWQELALEDLESPVPLGTRVLNTALVTEWNLYLDELDNLDINIPTMEELDIAGVPENVEDLVDPDLRMDMDSLRGVGVVAHDGEEIVVPSEESILRTSHALSQLGKPYEVGGDGTSGWSCEPLALGGKTDLNAAYQTMGAQNESLANTSVGDVVFYADPAAGIHHAGTHVLGGFVISASAATGLVSASPLASDAFSSVRPGTDATGNEKAPQRLPGALEWKCGGISGGVDSDEEGWLIPIPEDAHERGLDFLDETSKFNTGLLPGIELLSEEGQTVVATLDGTVASIEKKDGLGTVLTLAHSENVKTVYYGLSTASVEVGYRVERGSVIGVVGDALQDGEAWSVVVEINQDGKPVDPEQLFFPKVFEGQYQNGKIPASALCSTADGRGMLRCDAARAFDLMAEAFERDMGKQLIATDFYRSYENQVKCRENKGSLCATPGTSNHGWGLAVDFATNIDSFGTPEHQWMVQNAGRFGWVLPFWAQQNGDKPEPWHWEFGDLY